MFVGLGFITLPLAVVLYTHINKQRAAAVRENGGAAGMSVKEIHELGDRAPDFKYTL